MATATSRLPNAGERPYLGGLLLVLAGVEIVVLTWQIALSLLLVGRSLTVVGFLFGVLIALTGAMAITWPNMSNQFGVVGAALSILALIGGLGGLLVGTLLGLAGSSMLIAWQPKGALQEVPGTSTGDAGYDDREGVAWQDDQAGERATTGAAESGPTDATRGTATPGGGSTGSGPDFSWQEDSTSTATSPGASSQQPAVDDTPVETTDESTETTSDVDSPIDTEAEEQSDDEDADYAWMDDPYAEDTEE